MKLNNWCLVVFALVVAGCNGSSSSSETTGSTQNSGGGDKDLVFFAQANSADPWRQVFDANMKSAADAHKDHFDFQMQEASDDANKQINQVETVLVKQPKVLLISPVDNSLTQAVEKVYDAKIPVILLDRSIESDKYTCWIGGDNVEIGRQAGEYLAKTLNGKGAVLEIKGLPNNSAAADRSKGFREALAAHKGITVIDGNNCNFRREDALNYMESFLQSKKAFDAVYAHNDEMAIGAYLAIERAKSPLKPIVGIDACQQEIVNFIKEGKIAATFLYPQPGARGIEIADEIIHGNMPTEKKIVLETELVTKENADDFLKRNPNLAK